MRSLVALASASVVVLMLLAGCSQSDGDPTTSDPVVGACSIDVSGVPAHVVSGETFDFAVEPLCPYLWETNHVAAHYSTTRHTTPSLAVYDRACAVHADAGTTSPHPATSCKIDTPGTYYLRGHAKVGDSDLWGPEYVVVVQASDPNPPAPGSVRLELHDVPSTVAGGQPFTFGLEATWAVGTPVRSEHVGAHQDTVSHPAPTGPYGSACDHQSGDIPGSFTISCTMTGAGGKLMRGHAKFTNGDQLVDYWSSEVPVVVA